MSLDVEISFFLAAAAFAGALLNAVAGGGSLVLLPALLLAGVAPVSANATGTVALLAGYVSSIFVRRPLKGLPSVSPPWMILAVTAGGLAGAVLLTRSSDARFLSLVPVLLGFSTALFLMAPALARKNIRMRGSGRVAAIAGFALVGAYGGYFNGGVGILLAAHLVTFGMSSAADANHVKNVLSIALTAIAVAVYQAGDLITLALLPWLVPATLAGGLLGGYVAGKLPDRWLRGLVVCVGATLTIIFSQRVYFS